jgi:uncharacterized membrane protein
MFNNFIENHYSMDKMTIRDKLMNQTGGGDNLIYNYIHLIIGIVLIVIGIMLYNVQDQWEKTTGMIINMEKNKNSSILLIEYKVFETILIKKITSPEIGYKTGDKIDILYEKVDPNIIKLNELNYKYIGTIILIIGLFTLGYNLFN